jgi:nitroreductase
VIYLHFDKGFNAYAFIDGGLVLQTIALLAREAGLGTCILTVSISYPDVVRKHAGLSDDQALVMGMAVGYPVEDHPANRFRSERGQPGEFIRYVDMGD